MTLELGKFYWIRLNKGIQWLPAERIHTDYGDGWCLTGVDAEYYDREIAKVGPEIVPPVHGLGGGRVSDRVNDYELFKDRVADNDTAGAVEIVGEVVFRIEKILLNLETCLISADQRYGDKKVQDGE